MFETSKPKAVIAGALVLLAGPASAQDTGEDWDLGHDADRDLTIAAVTFDTFGVAVRCRENALAVVVSGLPPGRGVRTLGYSMGGSAETESTWVGAGDGRTSFAIWPASIANQMKAGGRLSLTVRDGGRGQRIAVDLPPSASAIDQVLAACGREDAGPDHDAPTGVNLGGLVWRDQPRPVFPSSTGSESGIAALTCDVDAVGELRGCQVESEFPEGGGFGRAATLGAHRYGRVEIRDGETGTLEGRRISFTVRYLISDDLPLPPSRLPERAN